MIEIERLKTSIINVEKNGCSINFKSARILVEKVSKEYRGGMSREKFVVLVNNSARELELGFNYCRVAFSYCSSKKENVKKNEKNRNNTEHLQNRLTFYS